MAKTVVITGTSTGIGRACVEKLAGSGWTVYAGVRKEADAETIKAAVEGDVRPVILDVTKPDQVLALARIVGQDNGGRLDALVNNAGVSEGGPIEGVSDETWHWHFEVNVFGLVRVTRELLPLLRSAKGRVVNISSIGGRASAPMMAPYSAGKHAVEAITESLRFEVEGFGMKVSCVEPGEIATAIWDKAAGQLERMGRDFPPEMIQLYDHHVNMIQGFVAEGPKRGVPASRVADVVHHALTSPRPKHRYLVGPDAKLTGVVTRMPDGIRHWAFKQNIARWAKAGERIRASQR
jgi:NAD(P)-dependent dehydrogenase (short-subunit alcohol dehydrogenase family)